MGRDRLAWRTEPTAAADTPGAEIPAGRSRLEQTMAVDTSQFKNGVKILLDGEPFTITYFQHVKPGKGGAFVRTKVKNLRNARVLDKTFRSGEEFT